MSRRSRALALTVLSAGAIASCDRTPSQPHVPSPPLPSRLSGTVFEVTHEGTRPLAHVRVSAPTGWDIPWTTTTDASGRYAFEWRAHPQSLAALKEGFSQPCRPRIDRWLDGTANEVDIYLVADAILAARGMPPGYPIFGQTLSGTVYERGSGHRVPVSGAEVGVDFTQYLQLNAFAGVRTVTDFAGRYVLCGMSQPYRVFWDEGAANYPEGQALVYSRRTRGAPATLLSLDVRTLTHLDLEID